MSVTRICLVRHGETAWNVEKRLQGHLDIPLNETGVAQAAAAAQGLAGIAFSAIYSSDLLRARTTAQAAADVIGLPVQVTAELRERNCGEFQALTQKEAAARFPDDYHRYHDRDVDFVIPGGESLGALAARITATFNRIAAAHGGEIILIVSHGGVLDIIHRLATGMALGAPRDFHISNAALNWLDVDDGKWTLIKWDDTDHLDEALDELPG